MAKSKSTVEVDVKVDDKGNLGQVGNKAKKAGSQFGNLADNARTADRRLKGASAQSANGTKNFSKMAQGVGGLVGIYATLAAQVFAVTAAFQFFQRVGDLRVLQDSQVAYASTTGVAIGNLSRQVRSAADGFLTFEEASKAAAIGVASGLTQESLIKLGKGAAAVSKVLGRDVADSFDRLVRGVTKAEPELLDELGITLRLEDAKNKFAISLNKTAGELSLLEQKQAVNVEVQRQLEEKFISTTEAIDTQGNAIKKFGVAFNNVFVKFANVISGPVEAAANFFSENITSLIAAIALFSGGIIKTMLPSFDAFTLKAEESASRASAAYDQARQSFKAMQDAQGQQGLRTALSGVDARPGSGIANLQGGKEVTKRQAAALLRYANMEKGVYNELTRYQKTVYKKALKDILGAKETFAERSKRIFFGLGQRINTVTKGIAVQWKRAMASMSAAVTKLGTAVDKAFRIFFAINIGLIAFNAAVKGLEKLGVIDKVPQSLTDLQGEIDDNRTALQGLNKEFARLEEVIEKRIAKAGAPTITIFKTIANAVEAASKELQQFTRLQNTVDAVRAMRGGKIRPEEYEAKVTNDLGKVKIGTFTALRGPKLNVQDSIESAKRLEAIIQGALTKLSLGGQQLFGNLYKTITVTNEDGLEKTVRIIDEDLVNGFIALGQTVTSFEESFNNSNRTFDRYISNIKTFQTTVSDQINATINEIDAITSKFGELGQVFFKATASDKEGKDLFSAISKEAEQLRVTLEKRLGFLFLIADMETKIAEEKEDSAVLHNLQMQRATKLVQQRLQAEKQIRDLDDQRRKLTAQIALSQGENIKRDKDKLSILEKQEANLRIQVELLKEQQEFLFKLGMAAAQAFEDGLSKGLEGLISGEETSFTKVLLNIVDTIKKAMAKRIAESITEQIMSTSILQKITGETAEQKMQAAIAAGGLEAAALMEAAMKKGADFFLEKLRNASTVTRNPDGTLDTSGVGAKVTQADLDKLQAQQAAREKMEYELLQKQLAVPTGTADDPIYTLSRTLDQAKAQVEKQRRIQEDTVSEDKGTDATISLDGSVSTLDTSTIDNTRATDALSSVLRSGIAGGSRAAAGSFLADLALDAINFFKPEMAKSGGIMTPRGKVSGYAHGGVARGPMSGYPAILHGREAVVPLPNGKAIPVEMKNGGGTQNNIVVNVSADGRTTTQGGGADMDKMGIAIAKAVQVELQNQKRSGGILNPYGVA